MAKISSLAKLGLEIDKTTKEVQYGDITIEIKNYLPVNEKLDLISWVINQSADDLKFYNIGKLKIFLTIAIVKNYAKLSFTDKQLENPAKLYDLLICSKLYETVINTIPKEEYEWIYDVLMDTVNSVYKYQNSVMGILDAVSTDYKDLNFDVAELQKNISNPENLTLLKDVVTKLG